jgi:hypothetical protein
METIAAARDRGDECAAAAGSGSAAQRRETVVVLLDEEGLPLGDFLQAYPAIIWSPPPSPALARQPLN